VVVPLAFFALAASIRPDVRVLRRPRVTLAAVVSCLRLHNRDRCGQSLGYPLVATSGRVVIRPDAAVTDANSAVRLQSSQRTATSTCRPWAEPCSCDCCA
jgi:hypothetical protein